MYDAESKNVKYALLFGEHHMFGTEGMEGLPTRRPTALSDADPVTYGLVAQTQDIKYNQDEAEIEAAAARNTAKPKATKTIGTPKETIVTRRRAETDEKESAANDEDNDEGKEESVKKSAIRHSKRLSGKDDNDSDITTQATAAKRKGSNDNTIKKPDEKKQKMSIGKSTPSRNAPTTTSSPVTDDWAATSETPQSKAQHGKLLPLLVQKGTSDIKKLEADLSAAQSKVKALEKVNEELRDEANEAKKAGLGTRPLMTRLMHTARASQGTLVKIVTAIADYQLTNDDENRAINHPARTEAINVSEVYTGKGFEAASPRQRADV